MTDAQKRLVELDLKKAEINAFYEELDKVTAQVAEEVGIDGYFQSEDKIVYKISKQKGTYVSFRELCYLRTKREGEKAGTLSVKEAKENGFEIT